MPRRLPTHGIFGGIGLPDEARERANEAFRAVETTNIDHILSQDVELLIDEFLEEFGEATIIWDDATMTDPKPIETNSYQDAFGQTVIVPQVRSTLTVPLEGHALLLTYHSHRGAPMMPIDGTVTPESLQLTWTGDPATDPRLIQQWVTQKSAEIERFLTNNNLDVIGLNQGMRNRVRGAIQRRRTNELNRRNLAASLPFPITRKEGATKPVKLERKKMRVVRTQPACPFEPEPELDNRSYEDILVDLVSMATVYERTPLGGMKEEHFRNVLLGMLNTNWRGDVAGEVFNGRGKTDILIREGDRNIFIGECKFYDGPKSVSEAVDQLLTYMVWRDTKGALLLFVRGGEFSEIVAKAVKAVSEHAQCQKVHSVADAARRSDYTYTRADDADRAIHLAVLPFKLLE